MHYMKSMNATGASVKLNGITIGNSLPYTPLTTPKIISEENIHISERMNFSSRSQSTDKTIEAQA